ncbi:MAG: MFS transporter [Deltaproteobacteria bacterium]|nr:MFS transporter [Deltaproteobacteria bacterium]
MQENDKKQSTKNIKDFLWVNFLYFTQGLPFTFLRTTVVPAFLKSMGESNHVVGFTSLLGIPYTFKFLWSPFVDLFWKKRSWTLCLQALLLAVLVLMSFIVVMPNAKVFWWVAFGLCAFLSATSDIAIDGFYLEALDEEKQAAFAGVRTMAYRVAMILGSSIPLVIAERVNWFWAFMSCAVLYGICFLYNLFFLPRDTHLTLAPNNIEICDSLREEAKIQKYFQEYGRAFLTYLEQKKIILIISFVIIYKLGDAMLFAMNTPFLLDLGITKEQLGWIGGTLGKIGSIAGSLAGGWWVSRIGLKKGLWQSALFMNFTILVYGVLALAKMHLWEVAAIHFLEQFAAGIGATAFVIFQMRTCSKEFKASHYAISTSLIAFGPMISGPIGGYLSEWLIHKDGLHLGYAYYFLFCFLASLPGLALIHFLPWEEERFKK